MSADVLVGDIGGTHVRFGWARISDGGVTLMHTVRARGDDFARFDDALQWAMSEHAESRPPSALFALAGPIADGAVTLTNRPWRVDAAALAAAHGFSVVYLRNDFEAMARSAPALPDASFSVIQAGARRADAPMLVAGPGTGFGMATLAPSGARWRVIGGEGGHQAYASHTPFEWAVARRLAATGFVSVERVCAGVGFRDTLAAVRAELGLSDDPELTPQAVMADADASAPYAIAFNALRACAVLDACGDGALAIGARGGVVIAGGVAERLERWLSAPEALARFRDRGPMAAYMAAIPIRLLRDPLAPLIGAALLYADLSERG